MILGYVSKRSKWFLVGLLPVVVVLQGISELFLFFRLKVMCVFLPFSLLFFSGCGVLGRSITTADGGLPKDEFVRYVCSYCPTIKKCLYAKKIGTVNIGTPEDLDNYLDNYKNGTDYSSECVEDFSQNLCNALVKNYRNDYIVIVSIYYLPEMLDSPMALSSNKKFIVDEYLYRYFNPKSPDKNSNFLKICNVLADSVYALAVYYNYNDKYEKTIELIDFVLKERGEDIDELYKAKLNTILAQAHNRNKITGFSYESIHGTIQKSKILKEKKFIDELILGNLRLSETIESEINKVEAYYDLAIKLKREGDLKGAIEYFTKIIELNPNRENKYKMHSALNVNDSLKESVQKYNAVVLSYQRCISPHNYAAIYHKRGEIRLLLNDTRGAIKDYDKAIELNSYSSNVFISRGDAYFQTGELSNALKDYDKAIELTPASYNGYFKRARCHKGMGELSRAIDDYNNALEIHPENADAYNNRGNAYLDIGMLDKSFADLNMAVSLDPDLSYAYNNLAFLYASTSNGDHYMQFSQALGYATKAADLNCEWYILDTLAAVYARGGEYEKAVETEMKAHDLLKSKGGDYDDSIIRELIDVYRQKKNYIQWKEEHD